MTFSNSFGGHRLLSLIGILYEGGNQMGSNVTLGNILDYEVGLLKSRRDFRIQDTKSGKIYLFRYDDKSVNLYLVRDGKEFAVSNPGSALYAFAAQENYFELRIQQPAGMVYPSYFLENIIILDN